MPLLLFFRLWELDHRKLQASLLSKTVTFKQDPLSFSVLRGRQTLFFQPPSSASERCARSVAIYLFAVIKETAVERKRKPKRITKFCQTVFLSLGAFALNDKLVLVAQL